MLEGYGLVINHCVVISLPPFPFLPVSASLLSTLLMSSAGGLFCSIDKKRKLRSKDDIPSARLSPAVAKAK